MDTLPLELRKLSLTEKQVQVYLAALKLGQASVQQIAQQAKISRPTAYQIIDQLKQQDLISESKQAGKRYFFAQSPDHLLGLLRTQKRELEEKEREFIRIIAELRNRYETKENKLKSFQGEKDIQMLLDDFKTSSSKQIYVLVPEEKIWPTNQREKAYQELNKRLGEIKIKEISKAKEKTKLAFVKSKSLKQDSFKQALILYDKAILLNNPNQGLLINNQALIKLLKNFFDSAWKNN